MFNIIETVNSYSDTWNLTFYYILVLIILIGAFWAYLQIFIRPFKKKKPLKENIIYQNTEDVIENYNDKNKYNKKNKYYKYKQYYLIKGK